MPAMLPPFSALGASLAPPAGDYRFIAIDVETASSRPGSICQIGLACVRHDHQIEGFSMLVNPQGSFDAFNTRLHGIGPEHVENAPGFGEAMLLLLPLLSRHILIQHSDFDRRAFHGGCDILGLPHPPWQWLNSVTIARKAWPEFSGNGGHGLGHLKQALSLDFTHHDAGEDARAAALVVLAAEARLGATFDIIAAGKAPRRLG